MPQFSELPLSRRTMSKKIDPKSIPAAVKIRRGAKAFRSMTVQERFQVMLKAGLLTRAPFGSDQVPGFSPHITRNLV